MITLVNFFHVYSTTNHSLSSSQDGDAAMERDKRAIYRYISEHYIVEPPVQNGKEKKAFH